MRLRSPQLTFTALLSLLALEPLGVEGVIVGRALYDGSVDLAEALQAVTTQSIYPLADGRWAEGVVGGNCS